MSEKINFLKEKKELEQKILLLYQILFSFEKEKFKGRINENQKDGKQTSHHKSSC
jgi:hypothetical protein